SALWSPDLSRARRVGSGHEMPPVPAGEPAPGEVLPGVRDCTRTPVRELRDAPARGGKVLFRVRNPREWPGWFAAIWVTRVLHAEAPGRTHHQFEGSAGRRAQAGHRALRRPEGLHGTARGSRPGGGPEDPRPRAGTDDGGRPPLRGDRQP